MRNVLIILSAAALVSCASPVEPTESTSVAFGVRSSNATSTTASLSLDPRAWEQLSSPSNSLPLSNDGTGLSVNIPAQPNTLNYLFSSSAPSAISGSLTVTLEITATPEAIFSGQPNGCDVPANLRPYILQAQKGQLKYAWSSDDGSWWSNPTNYVLAPGRVTLTVPLTSDRWSNVNGQFGNTRQAQFDAALKNVGALGITMGVGCFFGHGVWMSAGSATLKIVEYRVG